MKIILTKRNKQDIVAVFLLFCFAFYIFWGVNDRKKHLSSKDIAYSIGNVVDVKYGGKVQPWFIFYFYNGKKKQKAQKFISYKTGRESNKYINRKFLVKFSKEKPLYNELLLNYPIPDDLQDCNKCVWDEPPFPPLYNYYDSSK